MKYINKKTGSVLSVIVTIFVMIAFVSTSAIILLQKEIIYINPKYIVSKDNDVNKEQNNNQNDASNLDLSKYEGTINGKKIKSMLEEVIVNKIEIIDIYISENAVGVGEAASDKANIILLSNAKIANNDEYLNIKDNSNYKVIFENNSENVVQKIYVIKLI